MQRTKTTRLFRYVFAVLFTVLLLFPLFSTAVYALTPFGYNMSSDYKKSIYYENLTSLTLTGDQATDVLAVAMSQLGYHEGNGTSDFGGTNSAGSKNFVEYNRLYGKLDNNEGNGTSYGYAWCASFVNWCLRQAGVDRSIAGGEVSCTRWINEFLKSNGIWKPSASCGGSYTPKAGDLIFFKTAGASALSTHVGLVRYTDGTYVYTVEGNTASGSVALDSYRLDSTFVIGYGTPPYESSHDATCDYAKSGSLAGTYIVTADSLNVRAAASTASTRIGVLAKSELVEVSAFESGFARITTRTGLEGYTSLYYLTLVTTPPKKTYTVTFLDRDGSTVLSSLLCEENTLPTPPSVSDFTMDGTAYTFAGWSGTIIPATENAVYVALYHTAPENADSTEDGTNGEADSDGEPDSDGGAVPDDSAPPTSDDTGDTGAGGCASALPASALLPLALLPLSFAALLRKRTK